MNIILVLTILLILLIYCYINCYLSDNENYQDLGAKLKKAKEEKTLRNKQDVDIVNKKQAAELNILDTEKKTKDNIIQLNANIALIKQLNLDLDKSLLDSATNLDKIININKSINSLSKTITELASSIPNNTTYKDDYTKGQTFISTELQTILTKSLTIEQQAYTNIIQEYNNLVSNIESLRSSIENYIVEGDLNQVTNLKNQIEKALFRLPLVVVKIPNIPSYETTYKASQVYIKDKLPLFLSELNNYISRTQPNVQKYNAKQEQIKREKEMQEYQRNNPYIPQTQTSSNSSNSDYQAWLAQDLLSRQEQARQSSLERAQMMGNRSSGFSYTPQSSPAPSAPQLQPQQQQQPTVASITNAITSSANRISSAETMLRNLYMR